LTDPIIEIKGISKQYLLMPSRGVYGRLSESLTNIMMHPIRTISQRTGKREQFWALKDINMEIRPGEIVGVIGRNGAGKSTLLKVISQVTYPTEGEIVLKGRVGSLLEVGIGFHPELTGRENVYLNGAILGMKKKEIEKKFNDIVTFSEMEKFLDTPVKHYSSGMFIRLAFSVAAHLEPEILIVDEVLAVGDAQFQKKCLAKIKEVSERGGTVMIVTHNMNTIDSLCDRAYLIHQGKVLTSGPAKDITRQYLGMDTSYAEDERKAGDLLSYLGLRNRAMLDNIMANDDLNFEFGFRVGGEAIRGLNIDCKVYNEHNQQVLHGNSSFVANGFDVVAREEFIINFKFISPKLAPGNYHMRLHTLANQGDLCTWSRIDACRISNRSFFGKTEFFGDSNAPIIPEFRVSIERK
jgi:lipopolysaccharide transport system ATP-binding protein